MAHGGGADRRAMTALRIIYACVLDLRTDEAYYWTWSKE